MLPQKVPVLRRLELDTMTMKGSNERSWVDAVQDLLRGRPAIFELEITPLCWVYIVGEPREKEPEDHKALVKELQKIAKDHRAGGNRRGLV